MIHTMITAHSGSDETVDNSLQSIIYAIDAGADAVEVDVRRDQNGRLILSHDEEVSQEYKEALTLECVFKMILQTSTTKVNCDMKESGIGDQIVALAEQMGCSERLIFTGSLGGEDVVKQPALLKQAEVYMNVEEIISLEEDRGLSAEEIGYIMEKCSIWGVEALNINYRCCNTLFLEKCKEHNIKVSVWTVNEQEDLEVFLRNQVANITTKNLKKAITMRNK